MIRYLRDSDKDFLLERLLEDSEARKFLNVVGGSENSMFKANSDRWTVKFVYEQSEQPVGFICFTYHPEGRSVWVDDLYVIKEYRGQGHASKLLDFAENFVKNNWIEATKIASFTLDGSPAEVYKEKRGYKHMGTYKNFTRGMDQHYWVKELV